MHISEARLQVALHDDEQRLVSAVLVILNSDSIRAAALKLDGDAAQTFLDIVQNVHVLFICCILLTDTH